MAGSAFMALAIPCLVSVEVVELLLATLRQRSIVSVVRVKAVVYVAVKAMRTMKPGTGSNE
jgi:hypothetical protein